jgi:hypothetical protein
MQIYLLVFQFLNLLLVLGDQLLRLGTPVVAELDEFLFFLLKDGAEFIAAAGVAAWNSGGGDLHFQFLDVVFLFFDKAVTVEDLAMELDGGDGLFDFGLLVFHG